MILSHRAALNGVELDSVDSRILVQGIDEPAAKETVSAVSLFGGVGQRVTGKHRDMLEVTVRFSIHVKKNDMQARNEVFDKACAWAAGGGWLTINYKAGKRLLIDYAQLPSAGDQWNWTGVYSIVLRAYSVPFWQQAVPTTEVASGSAVSVPFAVSGSAETVMNAEFKNTSGQACATFAITAGESAITLENLALADGETLLIDHTDEGLLRIRIWNGSAWRSALDKRTAASSDDLRVKPGTILVAVTAQKTGALILSCAGRYL